MLGYQPVGRGGEGKARQPVLERGPAGPCRVGCPLQHGVAPCALFQWSGKEGRGLTSLFLCMLS